MSSRKNVHRNTPEKTSRLGFSTRLLLNFLAVGIAALVFSKVVKNNTSYNWLWFTFAPNNLENIKVDKTLGYQERLSHKLGVDFNYIMMIRDFTPQNAIIYYPSKDDFLATPKYGDKLPFNGVLVDKMTAIRFLYPRKVVVREEMGHTPYARRITHVGIVNGRHTDMLSYPVDSTTMHSILPVVRQNITPKN